MSVNPPDAREVFRWVGAHHREVFWRKPSVEQAVAFVAGFDAATSHSLLRGFQEWLVVRSGTGFAVHWTGLLIESANRVPGPTVGDVAVSDDSIRRVFDILIEFLDDAADPDTLRAILRRYDELRFGRAPTRDFGG